MRFLGNQNPKHLGKLGKGPTIYPEKRKQADKYAVYRIDHDLYLNYDRGDHQWVWHDDPFLLVPGVVTSMFQYCYSSEKNSGLAGDVADVIGAVPYDILMIYPASTTITTIDKDELKFEQNLILDINNSVMLSGWLG